MPFSYIEYCIHFTANTGIMNWDNSLCLFSNSIFNKLFINVHRIGTNINKYDLGTSSDKSIGS